MRWASDPDAGPTSGPGAGRAGRPGVRSKAAVRLAASLYLPVHLPLRKNPRRRGGLRCYLTTEPSYVHISGLTFATETERERAEPRASWDRRDVLGSLAVLVMILMAYLCFRG